MTETFFYSIIHPICSCRQPDGDLNNIGMYYKDYCIFIKNNRNSVNNPVEFLNDKGIKRMCCRSRFLSIPIVPMIDRSKNRIVDERKRENIISKSTDNLEPGFCPLSFPSMDGKKAIRIIPPSINIEGELPSDF